MTRSEFHVEDMRYEGSMVGLRRQLCRRSGIQDVATDLLRNTATVTFDANRVSTTDVEHFIAECGYRCRCCGNSTDPR